MTWKSLNLTNNYNTFFVIVIDIYSNYSAAIIVSYASNGYVKLLGHGQPNESRYIAAYNEDPDPYAYGENKEAIWVFYKDDVLGYWKVAFNVSSSIIPFDVYIFY